MFAVWLVRYMQSKDTSPPAPRWAWIALVVVGIIGQILMIIWFHVWQDDVRDLMGVPRLGFWDHPLAAILSIVTLFVFVEIGQLIGRLVRFLVRQLNRFAPPRVSAVVVVVLLLALTIALLNGVVVRFAMSTINKTFSAVNDETDPEFPAPTSTLRSGGPQSLDSWESLGHQGRVFVSAGPTVEELTKFNGKPAIEPIRAYAGLHSAPGIKATAQLAAEELRRTGGLDRAVVAVATTTGTGWINEAEASALEYMYNGNTAIVSMQYSFLPSWLSFLVDKENARQAGQALFEAVDAMVKERPEGKRPKLVVFGESLGSFGGEAPFLALNNLVARTDGALFSGPTFNNTIWEDLTRNRDKGSPMWLPIYDKGENVRFAARADNLGRPRGPVGPTTCGVSAARVRPDRVVERRSPVLQTGLAARAPRLRRVAADGMDPDRDVPTGVRRHGGRGRRARRTRPRLRQGRRQRMGRHPAAARLDTREDREVAPAAVQRRKRLNQNAFGLQRVVPTDDVGGAVQAEIEQRRRGQARGVALRAQHHPFHVVVDGLRQPRVAGRVAAPLEHVALDHQRRGHAALALTLGLRPDVDQQRHRARVLPARRAPRACAAVSGPPRAPDRFDSSPPSGTSVSSVRFRRSVFRSVTS